MREFDKVGNLEVCEVGSQRLYRHLANSPTSDDDNSYELHDEVADRDIDGVLRERQDDTLAEAEQSANGLAALNGAIGVLDPRGRRIFEARRLTDKPATLDELAAKEGLSREGVRQIELRAFKTVRHHAVLSDGEVKSIANYEFSRHSKRGAALPKADTLARRAIDTMRDFEREAA